MVYQVKVGKGGSPVTVNCVVEGMETITTNLVPAEHLVVYCMEERAGGEKEQVVHVHPCTKDVIN